MKISQILKIQPGVTALIGGGGKTTLMYRLAKELSAVGTVIVGTSTKIVEPEDLTILTGSSKEEITAALQSRRVICIGTKADGGKLSAPLVSFGELAKFADYIIVEADGAHRLPIKAHAGYEPVIPEGTNKTILVIGADAFGKPIAEICHRPELFAKAASVDIQSVITPEIAARVIAHEGLGDYVYINKVETDKTMKISKQFAEKSSLPVAAGSLKTEEYLWLC